MINKKRGFNKKAIEMTFNWIFAVIVGGFILFIAIYGATKLIRTGEQTVYTETAASLISLFDPLETGLASGKASEISFKKKSRIYFSCDENSNSPFGRQTISFTEQTFGDEFGEKGGMITIKDKYIFSENILEGKNIYYFSKPLFMGFKVTDLLMIYSDKNKYCVYNADEDFRDDIEGLNLKNIIFPNSSRECQGINVCFSSGNNCDIRIFDGENYLIKQGKKMYYKDDLIYAAIFSSPDIYECNIKRIKNRYDELSKIYLSKISVIERKECEPKLGPKLASSINQKISNSRDLVLFFNVIEDIDSVNQRAKDGCKLYYNVNFGR